MKISVFVSWDPDRKNIKLDTNFCIKFLQAFIIILIWFIRPICSTQLSNDKQQQTLTEVSFALVLQKQSWQKQQQSQQKPSFPFSSAT